MNPPDTHTGIYKGHHYTLTETGKHTAVDESGDTWTLKNGVWKKNYVKQPRPQDGTWMVFDRYHSGFESYKEKQVLIAEKRLDEILQHKPLHKRAPAYVPGPESGLDNRQTEEFYTLLESERIRAQSLYDVLYRTSFQITAL